MKTLIIFRGQNNRGGNKTFEIFKNLKKTIFNDLKKNNIEYDIAFVTYESEILNDLKNILNPKYVITDGFNTQVENFNILSNLMLEHHKEYDRFVICRFDYRYRHKITKWPSWDKNGIIITNRDPSGSFLYSDILFICDSNSIEHWMEATKSITMWPHQLGQYLLFNQIPFHLMYDAAYGRDLHPLYVAIEEDEPYLTKPFTNVRKYDA
jgi:hypothetical protein